MGTRPAIFKWRQTEPGLILCAVRWYLRYSLSLRDVEELLEERGLDVDHTTVWRWVQLCLVTILSGCEINNFAGHSAKSVYYNFVAGCVATFRAAGW